MAINLVDELLSTATPIKRPRASLGGASHNGPGHTPSNRTSTPANSNIHSSGSRPTNPLPTRLASSPVVGSSPGGSGSMTASPSNGVPFASRTQKFEVQESLNADRFPVPPTAQAATDGRIKLFSSMDPKKFVYRYQFERMMERSEVLDATIDEAAEALRDMYNITEEFGDPGAQTQEDVIVVGRLCAEADGMKMSDTTTWLESSRTLGAGHRVLLKFEEGCQMLGGPPGDDIFPFFPGALVGLRGRNGGGKMFGVSHVWMLPPIDAPATTPSELLRNQYGTGEKQLAGQPLSVITAAGPFTVDANLNYEPLDALITRAGSEKPDALILIGPFVDSEHPLIKNGDVDQTPTEIFRDQISPRLVKLAAASRRTTVLLVPSARDLISNHLAYPQSPFIKDAALEIPKGVRLVSNPATFSINEVVFAVTSVDTIFHLRNQEFTRKVVPTGSLPEGQELENAVTRSCRSLLRQRSYYPIFPTPLGGKGIDPISLDITHNDLVKMGSTGPDVIILPSKMKHFARNVESTVIVNPQYLTRGNGAGTYARLSIHPIAKGELEYKRDHVTREGGDKDEPIEHEVWDRCRADIIKI
ncbi:DNA polymerase alpha subunit B [Pseudohyphozyma bogoriensis]|nr:DNA polymerase alpha subunit B [Pseudohyphozyma bogoriensis]